MLDDLKKMFGPSFDYVLAAVLILTAIVAGLVLQYLILKLIRAASKPAGKACDLQMTDAKERSVEFRALVSAADATNLWNLRCQVREALVRYLAECRPGCLPRLRASVTEEKKSD